MNDDRRQWLRGAYLDRIRESGWHFAEGRTLFVDAEWREYVKDDFSHLRELAAEDHAYLRDQAGLEAFRRIVAVQSAAHDAAVEKLRAENADVVNSAGRFALDTGWFSLLNYAADRVRTYPAEWRARIDGAKEKFGALALHIDCDYNQRGCRSEVERLREEVRLRSLATCEICGEPGRLRLSGWAKTLCGKHASVMGEFREDDGLWADPSKWHDASSVIEDLLVKGRALLSEYPAESAELLRDTAPVRPRPKEHVTDPLRATAIGKRIDDDTWSRSGRDQELLIEFGHHIIQAVIAATAVADEQRGDWIAEDVEGWDEYAAEPLSDADRAWLLEYILTLVTDHDLDE